MGCDNHSDWKNEMDELAVRTRLGIARYGVHIIEGDDLAIIWNRHHFKADHEKRMHVENFASHLGLAVYLSGNSTVAIFRKQN